MARGFRGWIEGLLYTGLKSGSPGSAPRTTERGALRRAFDRYLSRGKNADPLYLSNRTWTHQAMVILRIGLPLAIVGGGVTWYILAHAAAEAPPDYDLTAAQVLAKQKLPDLSKIKAGPAHDIEVVEVGIERGSSLALAGVVRNSSSHALASAEVDFDVTDIDGSRLSTQAVQFHDLAPGAQARFRVAMSDERARIAIVRAIRTQ